MISFNKAAASAKRVSDILAEEPDITNGKETLAVKENVPVLSFDHVTFFLSGRRRVCHPGHQLYAECR